MENIINTLEEDGIMLSKRQIQFVRKLNTMMYLNYSDPNFNVSKLSTQLELSRRQFYREMSGLGLVPALFIRNYRLDVAMKMLQKGSYKRVKDMSYDVGYNSVDLFTKQFKLRFGEVPTYYMRVAC